MNKNSSREIRIFISSTFMDMQAERDYLIKKVFPRLQIEASKRGVSIVPLDLRWGITEEEAKSGKVIQACLQEIENSRPFFIGILGNRYGWIPSKDELERNEILQERWGDWLQGDLNDGLSVTEIEMQYGVLRFTQEINAYFYIRQGGEPASENVEKLDRLKKIIINNGRYPVNEYTTPEQLGSFVEQSFIEHLNNLYPLESSTKLERDRTSHRNYLNSKTQIYIPNEKNYRIIDDFVSNPDLHDFVIYGKSGMGKSSLIANWLNHNQNNNEINIIYHFIGNGDDGCGYEHILVRLCDEISDLYHLEIPLYYKDQTDKLNQFYNRILGQKPLLIVLDGINQISDVNNAKLLNWLPQPTNNIKYLFTTLENDSTMEVFSAKGFPMLELLPLEKEDKRQLIKDFLGKYRKSLLPNQIERLLLDKQNNNTFVLCTLLNELVNYGHHETLNQFIDNYLNTNSVEDFFMRVLTRFESDFGKNFVSTLLPLISFSKQGLTETEILELTGVQPLIWSQFYCAFKVHFLTTNGNVTLSHGHVRSAVEKRYGSKELQTRKRLIDYFRDGNSSKKNVELAFQYAFLRDYDSLYALLRNYAAFDEIYRNNISDLVYYWRLLQDIDLKKYSLSVYSDIKYAKEVNIPTPVHHEIVGSFILEYFGIKKLAKEHFLLSEWSGKKENKKYFISTARFWYNLACSTDNLDEAIEYLKNSVAFYESLTKKYGHGPSSLFTLFHDNKELEHDFIESLLLHKDSAVDREVMQILESYLLMGDYYFMKGCFYHAIQPYDKAIRLKNDYLYTNKEAIAKVLRRQSYCYGVFFGKEEEGIKLGREACKEGKNIPYEYILACYNLGMLLVLSSDNVSEVRMECNTLCSEIYTHATTHYPKEKKEFSNAMKCIAKIYFLLTDYVNCIHYLSLVQSDGMKSAILEEKDFEDYPFIYAIPDGREKILNKLGRMYFTSEYGHKDIPQAYYYFNKVQGKGKIDDITLWEKVNKERNSELQKFTNNKINREIEYFCRLVFPVDSISFHENYVHNLIGRKRFKRTRFYQTYQDLVSLDSEFISIFPKEDMQFIIERKGATAVFHEIRIAIVKCWRQLRSCYSSILGKCNLASEDDVLNAVELIDNPTIQKIIIGMVEVSIEMDGLINDCELYYSQERSINIQNDLDYHKVIKENDVDSNNYENDNERTSEDYKYLSIEYLKKNLDFYIAIYGNKHEETEQFRSYLNRCSNTSNGILVKQSKQLKDSLLYRLQADAAFEKEEYEEALENCQRYIELSKEMKMIPHNIDIYYGMMGQCYEALHRFKEALCFYNKCLDYYMERYGSDHKITKDSLNDIQQLQEKAFGELFNNGVTELNNGDYGKAKKLFEDASLFCSENDDYLVVCYCYLARIYHEMSAAYEEAISFNQKAADILMRNHGEQYEELGNVYYNMSYVYGDWKKYEEVIAYCQKALNIFVLSGNEENMILCYNDMGWAYQKLELYDRAIELHEQAYKLRAKLYGEKNESTLKSKEKIKECQSKLEKQKSSKEQESKSYVLSQLIETLKVYKISRNKIDGKKITAEHTTANYHIPTYDELLELRKADWELCYGYNSVKIGDTITIDNRETVVLDHNEKGILLVTKKAGYEAFERISKIGRFLDLFFGTHKKIDAFDTLNGYANSVSIIGSVWDDDELQKRYPALAWCLMGPWCVMGRMNTTVEWYLPAVNEWSNYMRLPNVDSYFGCDISKQIHWTSTIHHSDKKEAFLSEGPIGYCGDRQNKHSVRAVGYINEIPGKHFFTNLPEVFMPSHYTESNLPYMQIKGNCEKIDNKRELLKQKDGYDLLLKIAVYPIVTAKYQLALSDMYKNGDVVEKNIAISTFWLLQAARSGNKEAQLQIARMFQEGSVLPKDDSQAKKWQELAEKGE